MDGWHLGGQHAVLLAVALGAAVVVPSRFPKRLGTSTMPARPGRQTVLPCRSGPTINQGNGMRKPGECYGRAGPEPLSVMSRACTAAWLGCALAIASMPALAASNWLTLVGDSADPAADYIEFDPASLARENGIPAIAIRVSRAAVRISREGIVFRSFESAVAVDCKQASARFLRASFYAEPDFKGQPFKTVIFDLTNLRPMVFREIQGSLTQRVVPAACRHSAIKSRE